MGWSHGIITSDPVKIEYMLKTNFNNFPKGKYYRERFYDLLDDGISMLMVNCGNNKGGL